MKHTAVPRVALIILTLTFVLFKFQNCAPVPGGDPAPSVDGEARVIEDWFDQKLNFIESLVVVHEDSIDVVVDGLCERKVDSEVNWRLVNVNNYLDVIDGGSVACQMGGFRVTINHVADMECGADYRLEAELERNTDNVIVRRKCAPIAAVETEAQVGDSCYYELDSEALTSVVNQCYLTCYQGSKLFSREVVAKNNCPSLYASVEQ